MGLRAFEPRVYVDEMSDSESEPAVYVLPIIRKMRELQLKEPDKKRRECQAKVKRALSAVKAATGIHLINPDTSNPIDVGMVFEGNIFVESVLGFELHGACLCLKGKQSCEILVKEEPHETDCLWSDHGSKEYVLQVRHANGKVTNVPGSTLTLHPYCAFVVRFRRWLDGLRIYVNDVLVAHGDGQFACESSLQLVVNGGWDVKSVHIPAATLPSPFSLKLAAPLDVGDRVDIFGTLNAAPGGNMCLFTLEGAVVPCPDDMRPGSRIRVTLQRYKNRLCVYRCGQEVFATEDLSPLTFSGGLDLSSVLKPSAVWIERLSKI